VDSYWTPASAKPRPGTLGAPTSEGQVTKLRPFRVRCALSAMVAEGERRGGHEMTVVVVDDGGEW
jgi:hypothetical protein